MPFPPESPLPLDITGLIPEPETNRLSSSVEDHITAGTVLKNINHFIASTPHAQPSPQQLDIWTHQLATTPLALDIFLTDTVLALPHNREFVNTVLVDPAVRAAKRNEVINYWEQERHRVKKSDFRHTPETVAAALAIRILSELKSLPSDSLPLARLHLLHALAGRPPSPATTSDQRTNQALIHEGW